jgi:hypothetical protein
MRDASAIATGAIDREVRRKSYTGDEKLIVTVGSPEGQRP